MKGLEGLKQFEVKEEVMKIPFNPEIRLRVPTMNNHMQYKYMFGHVPGTEALS